MKACEFCVRQNQYICDGEHCGCCEKGQDPPKENEDDTPLEFRDVLLKLALHSAT